VAVDAVKTGNVGFAKLFGKENTASVLREFGFLLLIALLKLLQL